ncbi:hypothetical protein AB0I28_04555 [Phytomonospora sp. NPDC050363]|uniref:hypothetical protein n=1 Tax=Phytomonospora sp. NPDC050363 TaxID=3155642 RepID=UPI0033EAF3FA
MIAHLNHHIRTQITAEMAYAYRQFRSHLHDPWSGYCYPCDTPGPCPMYTHWLERLHALETAQQRLITDATADTEPEPDPDGEGAP